MRVMMTAVAVFVTWSAGGVAWAQEPPQQRIDTAIGRALQAGIPVALLENKIAEGKAKGVSLERIAAAVERREAALVRAQQVLKGPEAPDAGELAMAADAVESGVSDAVLRAVADSAPRERRAVAIAALTELVQLGHVPERALAQVQEALSKGRPEALLNLPGEAGRRGGPPAHVPEVAGGAAAGSPPVGGPPSGVPVAGAGRAGGPPAGRGGQ